MLRVGLTGGIGAGKSEVSRRLESYGAVLIDADAIAREMVAPGTPGLSQVAAAFGTGVLREDGSLDRERLGEIVFADAGRLARLNSIVHPLVGQRMAELEASATAADAAAQLDSAEPEAIVVHDVPLIAENNLASGYDVVVVVDVAEAIQLDRLTRLRGMDAEQAQARMAAQATRAARLAIADVVIDNSGSLSDLDSQVGDLWSELRRRAGLRRGGR
ncbi:MAG TPA: dephospho-CoA kinase [Streptosporangiaceae bacterium]|nr:dephospho-CoA kinase [Streptosporangiaceae bacterium]